MTEDMGKLLYDEGGAIRNRDVRRNARLPRYCRMAEKCAAYKDDVAWGVKEPRAAKLSAHNPEDVCPQCRGADPVNLPKPGNHHMDGKRLKDAIKDAGYTYPGFCEAASLGKGTLKGYLYSKNPNGVAQKKIDRFAKILGVSAEWLKGE